MKLFVLFFVLSFVLIECSEVKYQHPIASGRVVGSILFVEEPVQAMLDLTDLRMIAAYPYLGTMVHYNDKTKDNSLPLILDKKTFDAVSDYITFSKGQTTPIFKCKDRCGFAKNLCEDRTAETKEVSENQPAGVKEINDSFLDNVIKHVLDITLVDSIIRCLYHLIRLF
jgi:hypothetical protein